MKSLRECASIAVTAFEVTRGRYFDSLGERRKEARARLEDAQRRVAALERQIAAAGEARMAAVDDAELIVRQAWLGVASCYESEHDAFFDIAGYGG